MSTMKQRLVEALNEVTSAERAIQKANLGDESKDLLRRIGEMQQKIKKDIAQLETTDSVADAEVDFDVDAATRAFWGMQQRAPRDLAELIRFVRKRS